MGKNTNNDKKAIVCENIHLAKFILAIIPTVDQLCLLVLCITVLDYF